jgi:5-methylcytosine-specific restriction endonuclease McrA
VARIDQAARHQRREADVPLAAEEEAVKRTPLRSRGLSRASQLRRENTELCGQIVRIRDHMQCRASHLGPCDSVLQVAHIKPKGQYRSLQFHLNNLVLLCRRHHFKQHHMTETQMRAFWEEIVGAQRLDELEMMARLIRETDLVATQLYLRDAMKKMA